MKHVSAIYTIAAATWILVACGGGGGSPIPTPVTVTGTVDSWAADNRAKTTTTFYSDGTTKATTVDVPPSLSGGTLSSASGVNITSPIVNTFGNGVVQILEGGTATKPFLQSALVGKGNTDPNAVVQTTSATLDLRWGTRAAPYTMPTSDTVTATLNSTVQIIDLSGVSGYSYPTSTIPNVVQSSARYAASTTESQNLWITADVKAAWAQGWTGRGIKIGVIDDFTLNDYGELQTTPVDPVCGKTVQLFGVNVSLCGTSAVVAFRLTHGDQTSLIAGGSKSSLVGFTVESGAFSGPGDFGTYTAVTPFTVNLSAPIFGIAKDAVILRDDFLTYQSSTKGLFAQFQNWGVGTDAASGRYRQLKVVNLSLGGSSRNPVANKSTYQIQLDYANASTVPDAVFVKAAGNSGCIISQTDCDPLNAVFYYSQNYKNKSIIVGALDSEGGVLASYSNKAGTYSDRFVVADGRGMFNANRNAYDEGTSFSAPRVSGYVAILRQKFPNLNASSSVSVILDTAAWNSKWGARDASKTAIYGMGEANLGRALAPVGQLR